MALKMSEQPVDPNQSIVLGRDDFYPDVPPGDVPLKRSAFAKKVGVSVWTLVRLQREGIFKAFACDPRGGRNRPAIYLESQVETFRTLKQRVRAEDIAHNAMYSAEQAQVCFKAFDEGRSARWCVINTGLHPQVVALIRGRYVDLDQGVFIPASALSIIRGLGLDGPESIDSGADVLELVKKLRVRVESLEDVVAKTRAPACETCAGSKARFCPRCVANTIAEAVAGKTKGAETEASAPSTRSPTGSAQPTTTTSATTAPAARAPGGRSAPARSGRRASTG